MGSLPAVIPVWLWATFLKPRSRGCQFLLLFSIHTASASQPAFYSGILNDSSPVVCLFSITSPPPAPLFFNELAQTLGLLSNLNSATY